MSTTDSNDVTFSVPATTSIGLLVPNEGDVIPLVGAVTCRPDEVFSTFLINPDANDIAALPNWVINKCQAMLSMSDSALYALAQRSDVTTANIHAGVPENLLQWYPFLELTATAGHPLSAAAFSALVSSANPLQSLLISGADLGDADVAACAQLPALSLLHIRCDRVTGSFLSELENHPLTAIEVSGSNASPKALAVGGALLTCEYLTINGPHAVAELDSQALHRRFPNLTMLEISDGILSFGEDETPEDFAKLLPLRAAFAGTEVNRLVLTVAGAQRAAKRLGIDLATGEATA